MRRLTLKILPDKLSVCRLPADQPAPTLEPAGSFFSMTRTADEWSMVVPSAHVQPGWEAEPGWRCLELVGTFDFSLTGIMSALAGPLATAGISIFPMATWSTDFLLVRDGDLDEACLVLQRAGHHITR
ncbi:MAG: ACT domain-containing protein [Acidobacteria bacterium]|uniref:ACT domain-containing protein n=1 Tax=Candidatus Polarisedimenticola svalbardensis TaxID=2886004 RepID=A0A8J6XWC3_9BACT|nr:ACT domain-containing protein [Candidatus Polarisedimenticola svalbardensis]